ncbi:hypothetical protein VTL71DRAFT_5184 [Oculimacula yallundae]|uniref:BTB domain-containing protein n=1 Tax=Oculimacula yallundae TaxID=86028 RepID=A0ABR4C211_9HELO
MAPDNLSDPAQQRSRSKPGLEPVTDLMESNLPLEIRKASSSVQLDLDPTMPTSEQHAGLFETRCILSDRSPKGPEGLCEFCAQVLTRSTNEVQRPPYLINNPKCTLCSVTVPRKIGIKVSDTSGRLVLGTELLIKSSKYFSDSLGKGWKEANAGEYCLSDARLQDLHIFARFVRKGDLDDDDIDSLANPRYSVEETEHYVHGELGYARAGFQQIEFGSPDLVIDRLINCYLLGEYLQSPGFCNAVMDHLTLHYKYFHEDNGDTAPLWNLGLAFGGIRNSGLQRFVADILILVLSAKTLRQAIQMGYISNIVGEEISASALRSREKVLREDPPWLRNACAYHDHPRGMFNSPCHDAYSTNVHEQLKPTYKKWHVSHPDLPQHSLMGDLRSTTTRGRDSWLASLMRSLVEDTHMLHTF